MKLHLGGVGRWEYVAGTLQRPEEVGKAQTMWDAANDSTMMLLLKSMTRPIMLLFSSYTTPKAIWDAVATTYYDGSDFARVHDLTCQAFATTQAGKSLADYYARLKAIWQELDERDPNLMVCDLDIATHNKSQDKMRVHIFLNGLDSKFANAKGELLRQATPPTLEQAYAYVRKDESNQSKAKELYTEVSSLTVQTKPQQDWKAKNQNSESRIQPARGSDLSKVQCFYCKEFGHYKTLCPKKTNQDKNRGGKAAVQLVQEPDFYGVGGQDLTEQNLTTGKRGKIGIALKVSDFAGGDTWIIDSGASDHMTFDKSLFSSLSPSPVSKVSNANGVYFPVLGIGTIPVTPTMVLTNVLFVPALSHHLLSISALNSQNKCSVTFFPMYVIFQDLSTRAMIGRGDLRGRLFRLDCMYSGEVKALSPSVALTLSSDRVKEVWLWHRRMGHPSFGVMKKSIPSLFVGIKESSLQCETCVFA